MTRLVNRNVFLCGCIRTSMRLEPEFWDALAAWAKADGITLNALLDRIVATEKPAENERTSAVRSAVLEWAMGRVKVEAETEPTQEAGR